MKELKELVELAKKADREVTWSLLPFDLAKDDWCVEVVDYITSMSPYTILAIAEAFQALEKERDTLQAQLAELEKQEPIFQIEVSGNHWLNAGPVDDPDFTGLPDGINLLYAHPAPAINLAELVPDEMTSEMAEQLFLGKAITAVDVWNTCLAAILRKIEEQSK